MKWARCSVLVVAGVLFHVVHDGHAEPPGTAEPVRVDGGPPVENPGFERALALAGAAATTQAINTKTHRRIDNVRMVDLPLL
jgi:hypothetical protein